jgi:hypothetical protein
MKGQLIAVSLLVVGLPAPPADAMWASIDVAFVARKSPIIVTGKIVEIKRGAVAPHSFDTAYIRVAAIHKNSLTDSPLAVGDDFPVLMNGVNSETVSSLDISYPLGTEAKWLVFLENDGRFYINKRPEQKQPVADEADEAIADELGPSIAKADWIADAMRQQKAEKERAKRWRERKARIAQLIDALEDNGTFRPEALAAIDALDFEARRNVVNVRPPAAKLSLASYTKLKIHLMAHDPKENIKCLAASILGYTGDFKLSREPLLEALTSDLAQVRLFACQSLMLQKDKRCAPAVAALLADKDRSVRHTAVRALGWLGDERYVDSIVAVLEGDQPSLAERWVFTDALARLGERKRALRMAAEALDKGQEGARRSAFRSLAFIASPQADRLLVKNLATELERALAKPQGVHAFDSVFRENIDVLHQRTKQEFGDDIIAWNAWFLTSHGVDLTVDRARLKQQISEYRKRK